MLKKMGIFLAGVLLGGVAGAYLTYDTSVADSDGRISVHNVKELTSHRSYPAPEAYSDTRLVVYLDGAEGEEAEVLCQFVHGTFDPERMPEKVRIGPVSKKLGFGRLGYFCVAADAPGTDSAGG
jgi:hypothetical protein